eukprot:4363052-Amphidinium_carterae.1
MERHASRECVKLAQFRREHRRLSSLVRGDEVRFILPEGKFGVVVSKLSELSVPLFLLYRGSDIPSWGRLSVRDHVDVPLRAEAHRLRGRQLPLPRRPHCLERFAKASAGYVAPGAHEEPTRACPQTRGHSGTVSIDERSEANSSSSDVTRLVAACSSLCVLPDRCRRPSGSSAKVPRALRTELTDPRAALVACRTRSTAS